MLNADLLRQFHLRIIELVHITIDAIEVNILIIV